MRLPRAFSTSQNQVFQRLGLSRFMDVYQSVLAISRSKSSLHILSSSTFRIRISCARLGGRQLSAEKESSRPPKESFASVGKKIPNQWIADWNLGEKCAPFVVPIGLTVHRCTHFVPPRLCTPSPLPSVMSPALGYLRGFPRLLNEDKILFCWMIISFSFQPYWYKHIPNKKLSLPKILVLKALRTIFVAAG